MTTQPDPSIAGEEEEVVTAPFQTMEGDWQFAPFIFQVGIRVKKQIHNVWVQAKNKAEHDELMARDPKFFNRTYQVAVINPIHAEVPAGTVIQVIHPGNIDIPMVNIDWIKASLYAHPERDHTKFMPEVNLNAEVCNNVSGVLRANDGCHPDSEFSNEYYS